MQWSSSSAPGSGHRLESPCLPGRRRGEAWSSGDRATGLAAEQAIAELRALKRARANVVLSAGARQVVRMTLARPLADDAVLLGHQREMAALKVVGSGVDASAVGTGKTISSGRALAHRASTQPRFRGLVIAEGRLLGQWREELARGALGRGLPPLAPNLELLVLAGDRQIAGRIRRFDRDLGDRPGVVHVVSVLAARGAEHHQILDSFEGVHAAESTVATQLGEITGQVADSKDDAGYAATAARLRVAASVFGG